MGKTKMNLKETNWKEKKILYIFFVAGLILMYANYIPFIMDYYIVRPEDSIWNFLFANKDIININYEFESIWIGLALVVLYCITLNGGLSVLLMSTMLFALTYAGYIKYVNRKELLRLNDFKLTETKGMAATYLTFSYSSYLVIMLIAFLIFCILGFAIEFILAENKKKLWKKRLIYILLAALTCIIMGTYTKYFFQTKRNLEYLDEQSIMESDGNKYVLFRFLENDNLANIANIEDIEEVYNGLLENTIESSNLSENLNKPDIIVIMNESWWNTDNIISDKIKLSMDPMEPYNHLKEKCITGFLTSNVYGGGTVSSEAEFLTALDTKYFVGSSTIYADTIGRKLPSVIDYFHQLGYDTTAIHPYYGEFYNRDQVYRTFGFDNIIFHDEMEYRDIYSRYISDESLVNQIIAEYNDNMNTKPGKSQFIWAISIGNHRRTLEYELESIQNYDYPISVDLGDRQLDKEDYDILVNYINGIYLANQSFEQIVSYFEQINKPIIIVMYGDHIPNFSEQMLDVLGLDMTDDSLEMKKRLQSVPIAVWSNCLKDDISFDGDGIYYLPEMIFTEAGLPDSNMMRIRRLERTQFKANTRELVMDAEGNMLTQCTEDQLHILNSIKMIEYDLILGQQKCKDIWMPLMGEE